ncbi:MAG: hypothetical protein Kow00127_20450 [Bacteroidales bacterium]
MKFKSFSFLMLLIAGLAFTSCNQEGKKSEAPLPEGNFKGKIKEVLQATSYTYLNLDQDGESVWIAVNKGNFKPGETVYYARVMEMTNFESKDLQRTFDKVLFVQNIDRKPIQLNAPPNPGGNMGGMSREAAKPVLEKMELELEHPEGTVTIGDLWANKEQYDGKEVMVFGQVTKVNPEIMDRNWIHLQDGTGDASTFDLTVTTGELPEVGDRVLMKGTVRINQDFGMGYQYPVLLEDAVIVR